MSSTIFYIIVMLLGLYLFYLSHNFIKSGKAFIPIVYIDKQKNPRAFWIIVLWSYYLWYLDITHGHQSTYFRFVMV